MGVWICSTNRSKQPIMKYCILLLSFVSISSFSQDDPFLASDGFTPFWNNPAATASWNKFSINTTYRNQWPALSGNRQTLAFSTEADLYAGGKSSYRNVINLPIGFNAIFQSNGPQKIQSLNVPLSIPIKLGKTTLAIGAAAGIKRIDYDWAKLTFGDPAIPTAGTTFDLNTGLFWYGKRHYLGLSVTNLTSPKIGTYQRPRQYCFQAGYKIKLGNHTLFPMLNGTYVDGFYALRAMAYFQFKEDLFSIGAGFNHRSSVVASATVRIKKFKLAYVFEVYTSKLNNAQGNSHELRLSYTMPKVFPAKMKMVTPPF